MFPDRRKASIAAFGASGFMGGHLYRYFRTLGMPVIGTYRDRKMESLFRFDLGGDSIDLDFIPWDCRYAIIAAGNANVDYHKTHRDECEREVEGTKALIDALVERGIVPVYLSTDYVFEGTVGNYRETDATLPTTAYGRDKLAVEGHLLGRTNECLVIRVGKVYGTRFDDRSVILDLAKALRENREVRCAYDQIYSPTFIDDMVIGVARLIEVGGRGIFHLASEDAMSPHDLAKKVQKSIPGCNGRITPTSIRCIDLCEERPLNTTLNSGKLSALCMLKYRTVDQSLLEIGARYS